MSKEDIPEEDRAAAIDRAMRMAMLFQKDAYNEIMPILDKNQNRDEADQEDDFKKACIKHGLGNEDDIRELWKYLKHFKKRPGGGNPGW
jgi:hypothetical protein